MAENPKTGVRNTQSKNVLDIFAYQRSQRLCKFAMRRARQGLNFSSRHKNVRNHIVAVARQGSSPANMALWDIAMTIRELETRDVLMDGDRSYNELLDAFRDANRRLQAWIAAL